MKKIISVLLTICMLFSMFVSFSVTTSAASNQYVESFQIGIGKDSATAKEAATKDGYTLVSDVNLNYGRENSEYVYLGYKTTTDPYKAIRSVIALRGYNKGISFNHNNSSCPYYSVGGYYLDDDNTYKHSDMLDVNKGGNSIYIYTSTYDDTGNPISKPVVALNNNNSGRNYYATNYYEDDLDEYLNDHEKFNLNYGATDAVYLYFNQDNPLYLNFMALGAGEYSWDAKDMVKRLVNYDKDYHYLIDVDLNKGCGAGDDYIYLGWAKGKHRYDAIRDIIVLNGQQYSSVKSWVNPNNGCTYYPVGGYWYQDRYLRPLDLNLDAGGDYIYFFFTTDANAGEPITSLKVIAQDGSYYGGDAVKFYNGGNADLNSGAGGKYIYCLYTRYWYPNTGSIFSDSSSSSWYFIAGGAVVIIGVGVILFLRKRKVTATT